MKKVLLLIVIISSILSCSSDDDVLIKEVALNIAFEHYWGDTPVSVSDFNNFKFTTEHGEIISIERLRYLLSNIVITDLSTNESQSIKDYQLINVGEQTGLLISKNIRKINTQHKLTFTFGFTDTYNQDGVYRDLNSVDFNVPAMMGGGYHYMQFDGKYINDTFIGEKAFNYHAIRAVKIENREIKELKDTSFSVLLTDIPVADKAATITVKVDLSKWFTNNWDLNQWNTPLMPNYDAQIQMNTNGKQVFSLVN